jgi:hypothetical protein
VSEESHHVGKVISASNARFVVGCRLLRSQVPTFGALVKAAAGNEITILGLIRDVQLLEDPLLRQVAVLAGERPELVADQLQRLLPIEVQVQVVGYRCGDRWCQWLPPQPPMSLVEIVTCSPDELIAFTEHLDYFRLVLDSRDPLVDELLAANLRKAAQARRDAEPVRGDAGYDFLVGAGRELARLLAMDMQRLDGLLRRIRP